MKRVTTYLGKKILINENLVREIGEDTSTSPRGKCVIFFLDDSVSYVNDTLDELELIFNNSENKIS